jgi:23S rRNA (adenine2503-C2)-methyltransferase
LQTVDAGSPIAIHDAEQVDELRRTTRLDPHLLRRLRYGFYQLARPAAELLDELPVQARGEFASRLRFHALELQHSATAMDGAIKLVLKTRSGAMLESVILGGRMRQRASLCISSQVGCAVRCSFCATGQMPQVRNLTSNEIVDQVVHANLVLRSEGKRIRNIVFMGMGEPLHNEEHVSRAAEMLFSQRHFGLSPRRALLSTVGVPDAMVRWARRFPRTPLALSLHSARQDVRERLIPLARGYPLTMLRDTLDMVMAIQRAPLMIEYLLLEGTNDAQDDALLLADFLRGLRVIINLIPFNPVAHAPQLGSPDRRVGALFAGVLRDAGFLVTFRHSLGRDIDAACGQLVQKLKKTP